VKVVGVLLVIGIVFSYIPMISTDSCSGGNHMGKKLECGYLFHCPLILDGSLQEPLPLPLSGRLVLPPVLPKIDELTNLIFHPPKNHVIYSIS